MSRCQNFLIRRFRTTERKRLEGRGFEDDLLSAVGDVKEEEEEEEEEEVPIPPPLPLPLPSPIDSISHGRTAPIIQTVSRKRLFFETALSYGYGERTQTAFKNSK
ncbi:hypothetical protein V1478_011424, partial [Vespula squamosa]